MRHAICNEAFRGWSFADAAKFVRATGYTGLEIAPFTLAEKPSDITPAARADYKDILKSEGLAFVGLHWLMVSPKGLHVTTSDDTLRERSWKHIRDLIELCADLGPNGVMVFGSPVQRSTVDGASVAEATARYIDGLASVAAQAQERGVTILVEALPIEQANVVNTLAEAASIVKQIGSPAIQTMFDTHNAVDETEPHAALVEKYFDLIRHVHVNEMDGRHPSMGDYDFKPVLRTLERLKYQGWVSLEAFDFSFGAERIARESIDYLNAEMAKQE
ncbi:MAG TPA: sugar phosphate isomerase/epimerase family protein [Bryobacteraceae bacterium]|jgi:D-psicose/D-tagatose/L-ribulose 3-epimerase|nr:sugar phosphate isomerase/epimerase family protein [Bryobacteraceae bacterium]